VAESIDQVLGWALDPVSEHETEPSAA
jgi:hypothetical protein